MTKLMTLRADMVASFREIAHGHRQRRMSRVLDA
jgi:hypothetical protein